MQLIQKLPMWAFESSSPFDFIRFYQKYASHLSLDGNGHKTVTLFLANKDSRLTPNLESVTIHNSWMNAMIKKLILDQLGVLMTRRRTTIWPRYSHFLLFIISLPEFHQRYLYSVIKILRTRWWDNMHKIVVIRTDNVIDILNQPSKA